MRALTVVPLKPDSAAVIDIEEPRPGPGELLVDGLALGVCGTDREIAAGEYGWAPPGHERLVIGHESLGRVREAPADSGFAAGDLVVGVVRRPDPVPCGACARGEFDMCRNGEYTERGIKQINGFGSRALDRRGRLRREARPRTRRRRRPDGADHHRGQGLGPHRADRLARLLRAAARARDRRRADRAARGAARRPARTRGARPRPRRPRASSPSWCTPRRDLPRRTDAETIEKVAPPDIVVEATGVPQLVFDAMQHNARPRQSCA